MILSCIYLGYSGDTMIIWDLELETKIGNNYWETIYKWGIIR